MDKTQITVLVENTTHQSGLLAEHGLSFWIELDSQRILFDTGQSDILLHNAHALGADLGKADAIVLSHGHYDHVGGLKRILELAPKTPIYLHSKALEPKYTRSHEQCRQIGMDQKIAEILQKRIHNGLGSFTDRPLVISHGVTATGEIPRRTSFEDTGGAFHLDRDCASSDELLDDQALVLEMKDGLVVVLGCAHAGVVNTLDYVSELFPDRKIRMILGGMHLVQASHNRITQTIDAIRMYNVKRIGPAHCTGAEASRELWNAFPERCFMCSAGTRIML